MQPKIRLFAMTLSVILLSFVSNFSFAQTTAALTSDKDDYAPGEVVILTGNGFASGETVSLQVLHLGDDPDGIDPQYHEPWTVIADANGGFVTTWNVPTDGDALGETFKATANGRTSIKYAEVIFTDAADANAGDGTLTVAPLTVCSASTGNGFTFIFTNNTSSDFKSSSQLSLEIPSGWTAPQVASNVSPGYVNITSVTGSGNSASINSISGFGPWVILIDMTIGAGGSFTISYEGGGSKITVPTVVAFTSFQFTTKTKSKNSGPNSILTLIASQPNVTVNLSVPVSVSISSSDADNTICAGTSVTFTATPANGGTTPSYQWKLNGNNVGSNQATYTTSALANGDVVTVELTSNAICATGNPATATGITTTVNPNLPVSVSISSSDADNTICAGTSVTFTATPANGGTTPSYQWKLNGNNVGSNQATYTTSALANGDVVTVELTSNAICATGNPATATGITTTVNPNLPVSVSISSSDADNTICAGTSVTFTATPANGGTTPSYQWKLNGNNVGSNQATYTTSALANGDVVTVELTSNAICATGNPATATGITTTVNPNLPVSVSISSSDADNTICAGTSVTFTATPANGGTTPSYQWKLNGNNVGSNQATYTTSALANGDVVTVELTSNAICATGNPATATGITTTVNPLPNNTSFTGNTICVGETGKLKFNAIDASFVNPYSISYTDGVTTWNQVISSAAEVEFNAAVNPTSTTSYALVSITNGNGCSITTGFTDATAQITVRPLPLDKTITAQNSPICSGNGTNIQVASSQNGVNYQLRDNADNSLVGSAVGGNGGTINLPTGNLATTTTFNVLATSTAAGACSVQMTGTVTVTVNPTPSAPTGNATQSFVGPSTVANLQTTSGANIKWYDAATNGNLLLSTAALVTGNHYYASQTVNGCESVTRLDVKVILTEQTITSIDKTVYCSGENMVIEFKTTGTYQSGNEFKAELSNGGGNYPGGNPSFLVEVSPATVFDVQTIDGIVYTFYRMTVKIPIIRNAADHYNIRIDATKTEPNGLLLLGNNYAYNNVGFVINPAPDDFTVTGGGAYCSGGSGVAIGLDDSQTGVNYLLYHYTNGGADSSLITTVAGTGVAISFGLQTILGTYKVKAVFSNGTGCGIMMSGSATITADSPATVTTSNACAGGSTVPFTQAGGTTGGTWSVSGGGTIDPATGVFTPTTAGCFTATYTTPVANCTDTKSFVVFPAAPSAPVVSNTCNAALTIPALTVVAGFTAQYSFDGGVNWSTSNTSSSATPGCYSMKTRYVLTSACGGTAANATAPSACEASALGYAVIFPAKPVLNAPSNTCNAAFSLPSVTPVSGFTVQYSINDGGYAVLANVVVATTPGCYSIKARYVLTSVCGGNAANATAPATCFESDAVNVVIFPSAPVLTAPDNTCNAAFTLPSVTEVSSFTIQYKIDNGSWSAAPTVPTSTGCHTVKARYVLTSACGSITANTIAPASCEESNEVSVVIFPSAPSAPVVNNTCNSALTIPVVTPVSGFTAQYSFDGGTNWSTSNTSSSTTPGCYTMKSRYVLTNACGSTAANATAPTACEASAAGYAVIFPAKPSLSAPANTCASAFTLPTVTAVSGFTVQYSFNGGVYMASADVVVPTTPGCYSIKARYVLTSACGSNATNATAPASCLESDAVNVVIFPSAPVLSAPDNTCNAAFTLPSVTAKTGFTVQYKIDAGSWTASPTVPTTPGCHTIKARYVLTAACGGNAINATAPATCLESNEVSVVIFPAAPTITAPANVCSSMFTLPTVEAKAGFDIQYKIDNGNWEAAPTTTAVGCHTVKARYVLKDACGSNAVGTTAPAACAESNEVNVVIFPAAPPAPTVNSGAGAIVVTPPTSVSGFSIEYSFNDGSTWGANTPPTADNCDGYKIRTRYVTANACGSIAVGTSISCSISPYTLRIVDNTLPSITCKADVTTPTDAGLCDATVTLEAPTVSDACGIAANGLTNDHPSNQYPFGTTVVTWTVRDVNGNTNTCQQQVIVNKVTTTTTVTVTPVVPYPTQDGTCPKQQYSQKVSFTATVTPVCTAAGSIVNAASIVTFKIGTQTMGTAPVDATGTATLSNVNLTETVSGQLAAGTRTVTAVYSGYSNYLTSTGTTCLEIVKEDLCATYNGYMQVAAASTSKNSCKANFTMSVGVSDLDGYGDVSKVKVYFYVNGSTTPYIVDVVPINDTKTQGNASKNIDFSFNGTYTTIDIEYDIVSDYYQRSTEIGCDADGDVPINFYLPQNEFITGGGYVKPTQSAGKLSAESGRKANFGFNVKYTKSGTNLQGNINYIFRRLEDDNIIHVYQVKGNAMSTLTVNANANPRTAVFNGKCNVADVTENPNPLVPLKDYLTPLGGTGNSTMQVLVSDGGEPGISVDQYGITVWNSRGELFHSSNWISTQTVKQLLSGGNIQVSGATSTPYSITTLVRDDQDATSFLQSNVHEFSIAAYPNPTSNQFKVQLQSSDKVQKIQLRVTDITGRLIQVFNNLAAGQVMEIGSTYRPGIYILQMIQGNQHKQLKLLKIPD